ncbi:Fc.00g002780.m01.CDS01 [Cosmosporella sp. VM-42]
MALQELPGTIDYLTDAAHLLRMTAPETSSHLMSHRGGLLSQYGIAPSDIQRQHVCGACGYIMIPGQEAELKVETWRAIRKKRTPARTSTGGLASRRSSTPELARTKVLRCGNCKRDTKIKLAPPGPAVRRRHAVQPIQKKKALPVIEPPKATANASSKKRAKNRKAGLQALLSGQQQQTANPLSLAHFMKK